MTTVGVAAPNTELEPGDFAFLQSFLLEKSAIVLGSDKHYLVASRLGPVARQLGLDSVAAVMHCIRHSGDRSVETKVIEAMTINETLWFRDIKPFNALRTRVIPHLMEENKRSKRLSIWSAASSTGQEIYSMAMLLAHDFPELDSWRVALHGTDINQTVLDRAREGRFSSLEINRGLPADMMARYFSRDGAHYVLNDELRKKVTFSQLNLASAWPSLPVFDIILLRNVLIYFDNPTKERIIQQAATHLAPNGYLFLGSAETVFSLSTGLFARTIEGTTAYRKDQRDAGSSRR
jgi:chemotaxis protein methyltransferase CheR